MNRIVLISVLAFASLCVSLSSFANSSWSVKESVMQIVAEHEKTKGVNTIALQKGQGLGVVKAFLRPKLGKELLEGVTSIIIVEHSKASEEVCASLQERLNSHSATLQGFVFEDNEFGGGEKVRGYVAIDETTMVASELIMFVEDKGAKLLIYMGGVLDVNKMNLTSKQ